MIRRFIERMRARVAETYRDKPRTATTIHWTESFLDGWRWTPEATEILNEARPTKSIR